MSYVLCQLWQEWLVDQSDQWLSMILTVSYCIWHCIIQSFSCVGYGMTEFRDVTELQRVTFCFEAGENKYQTFKARRSPRHLTQRPRMWRSAWCNAVWRTRFRSSSFVSWPRFSQLLCPHGPVGGSQLSERTWGDTQIVKEDFVEAINNVLNSIQPSVWVKSPKRQLSDVRLFGAFASDIV